MFGSPGNMGPLLSPNQQLCSPATPCSLVLPAAFSICLCWPHLRNTLTPLGLGCLKCQHPPVPWHPAAPPWHAAPILSPVLSSGSHTWPLASLTQWFILSGRGYWAHLVFFGSVCTLLALNYPHHLPTKVLWKQCLFPTAHQGKSGEENQLGLCLWKSGPDFLHPAKLTVTQERQSSSWLHANLIVRLLNGFKWV